MAGWVDVVQDDALSVFLDAHLESSGEIEDLVEGALYDGLGDEGVDVSESKLKLEHASCDGSG